jgi:DNA-binding response OmpR family regulator
VRELLARVRNVLHRTAPKVPEAARPAVRAGSLAVDPARHEARLGDVLLALTPLEFDLLYTLAGHAGQVLHREQLLEQVWGYDDASDVRLVDSAVKRLRRKLRQAAPGRELVVTVRGVGYKLQAD